MTKQTAKAFRFSEEELSLLTALAKKYKSQKGAVMAGLRALDAGKKVTQDDVLDWIRRNTK